MAQTTITSYFNNRKRAAVDDFKVKSKVLRLDQGAAPLGYEANSIESAQLKHKVNRKLLPIKAKLLTQQTPEHKPAAKVSSSKIKDVKDANQSDLTSFFKKPEHPSREQDGSKEIGNISAPTVPFEVKGPLSPRKCRPSSTNSSAEVNELADKSIDNPNEELKSREATKLDEVKHQETSKFSEAENSSTRKCDSSMAAKSRESKILDARKELSLGEIKTRLNRSSRLAELKESLARLDRGRDQLAQLERQKESRRTPQRPDDSPRLDKFRTIEVEVPLSPVKSPLQSPRKLLSSPLKPAPGSLSPVKVPAYQRYSALAAAGPPSLILPYSYRLLAELFRCVDIVVSMMNNRKETVSFKKLRPAVQEMRRRIFTENHLAQMLTVFPGAFSVRYEKLRSFGSSSEKYEMIVSPLLSSDKGSTPAEPGTMTPAILAERQQLFYKNLLEITKDHHTAFLLALEPPIVISKEHVTRWHAKFMVDCVPEITPAPLPVSPNQEKACSAKDVLSRARSLFSCNSRMEKALESAALRSMGNTVQVEVVDGQNTPSSPAPSTVPPYKPNITSALKGLPKALLEKVRARQAAKALDAITRSAAQDKEATQYSRLPEIARILRNVFVAEKKGVLPLETVVDKVGNSCRNCLNPGELEDHLKLLAREVPGWITFDHLRKTDFVRLSKSADMNRVTKKLESLAEQKMGST